MGEARLRAAARIGLAALLASALAACAETQLVSHAVKEMQDQPVATGSYKVGQPYQINGHWYYPAVDYGYRETGIASWYGPQFHGQPTANGEIFDMNAISAAHRTLPLPSMVRVTNLANGRSLVVRLNDRGPFARGRIVDISRRGAQLLGFYRDGTARVRVEIMPDESRQAALLAQKGRLPQDGPVVAAAPRVEVEAESLPPPGGAAVPAEPMAEPIAPAASGTPVAAARQPIGQVTLEPVQPTNIFLQAGAFAEYHNALRLGARLSALGPTQITQVNLGAHGLFRVRIGPVTTVEKADRMLERMIGAGYDDARIVVE